MLAPRDYRLPYQLPPATELRLEGTWGRALARPHVVQAYGGQMGVRTDPPNTTTTAPITTPRPMMNRQRSRTGLRNRPGRS